jgi:Tfp pilus assembly PilM family ATPase
MDDMRDEITSTERLLDVIRGKGHEVRTQQPLLPKKTPLAGSSKSIFKKTKTKSQPINVGIDIGKKYVCMVKALRSDNKWKILEHEMLPIPADIDKGSDEFRAFLRSAVPRFCGDAGVWAIMSSARVDIRPIRIPKVSGKNLDTAVHWTLKKEAAFNEKESFLDYEVRGEVSESGNKKLDILSYTAPIEDVEGVRQLSSDIGIKLSGVSIVPFAVQNMFINNVMPSDEKQTASLFIGNDYSRIDLYIEGKLTLTRDIKTGINSILEMLSETPNIMTEAGENLTREEARKVLFAFAESVDKPVLLADGSTVDSTEVEGIITTVLERFVRQMERTIEYITSTLGYDRIGKVYISSIMPLYKTLLDYFGEQLGVQCEIFDPLGQLLPEMGFDRRNTFVPAFGMAMSDNAYTPNFIYTYKDKNKAAYVVKVNRAILTGLIISLLACSIVMALGWRAIALEKAKLAQIEREVQQNTPLMNKEMLLKMASETSLKNKKYIGLSRRYRSMAFISELSALTPETVSLTAIKAGVQEKTAGDKAGANAAASVVVEGVISSREDMAETILATYIMRLRTSPMISDVTDVSTSKTTTPDNSVLLTFAVNLKAGAGK